MSLEVIKADLPNTPEDIIDMWLLPHSKRPEMGWPPGPNNQWRYLIGLGRDLSFLQSMQWDLKEIVLTPEALTPNSLNLILSLYGIYRLRRYERLENCIAYIKEHGKFPRPVVLEKTSGGYSILDGSHRITAYFYLYGYFATDDKNVPYTNVTRTQSIWVGNEVISSNM